MFQSAIEIVQKSVQSIGAGFLERIPYLAGAFVILLIAWIVSKLATRATRKIMGNMDKRDSLTDLMTRMVKTGIWLIAIITSAMIIFPGLTPAKALGAAGLMSVAIGLAFKDIFQNFFAGILLLWKFPLEKGDVIECDGTKGRVEDIQLRMTTIRTPDNKLVVLPNSDLITNAVDVITNASQRRIEMTTGVAYGENVAEAVQVIEKAMALLTTIDQDKPVLVLPKEFGASSIDISLLFWTGSQLMDERKAKAEVVTKVKEALDNAGIEIPFPYRTLTFDQPLELKIDKENLESIQKKVS